MPHEVGRTGSLKWGANVKGQSTSRRQILHVEEIDCDKGGLHELGIRMVREFPLGFCIKCRKTEAEIDLAMNGDRS